MTRADLLAALARDIRDEIAALVDDDYVDPDADSVEESAGAIVDGIAEQLRDRAFRECAKVWRGAK